MYAREYTSNVASIAASACLMTKSVIVDETKEGAVTLWHL